MCTKSDDRFLTRGLFRALLFRGGAAPRVIVTLLPSGASAEAKAHSRSRDDPAPDGRHCCCPHFCLLTRLYLTLPMPPTPMPTATSKSPPAFPITLPCPAMVERTVICQQVRDSTVTASLMQQGIDPAAGSVVIYEHVTVGESLRPRNSLSLPCSVFLNAVVWRRFSRSSLPLLPDFRPFPSRHTLTSSLWSRSNA